MSVLNRATEQQDTKWQEVPEGLWRWIVGVPELKVPDRFGYRVKFPLSLTGPEQARLVAEHAPPPDDVKQSYRVSYTVGLSLGFFRQGQFQSTKLIDFLSACLGSSNTKKFREWIAAGGGPPRPEDKDDAKAEIALIEEWLKWWENLELYGTITHATDKENPDKVFARFAGPMAVGSLPGQKDDEYQAHGRGKLRAIIVESHPELAEKKEPVAAAASKPAVQFTAEGKQVALADDDDYDDVPF